MPSDALREVQEAARRELVETVAEIRVRFVGQWEIKADAPEIDGRGRGWSGLYAGGRLLAPTFSTRRHLNIDFHWEPPQRLTAYAVVCLETPTRMQEILASGDSTIPFDDQNRTTERFVRRYGRRLIESIEEAADERDSTQGFLPRRGSSNSHADSPANLTYQSWQRWLDCMEMVRKQSMVTGPV
jgi:hypothetical protein